MRALLDTTGGLWKCKKLSEMGEIRGGTLYGATTLADDGPRQPSDNELAIALQEKHVAEVTKDLVAK